MIAQIITVVASAAIGVYAGKKRAGGESWSKIASDMASSVSSASSRAWRSLASSVRRMRSKSGNAPQDEAK